MGRPKSPMVGQRKAALVRRIRELEAEHLFWRYRSL
jgi:hypothetical protein